MTPFRSVASTHLGGAYLGRSLMRMAHDSQMDRAYQSKDQGDFEEAAKTRQNMNLLDVLLGLLRLGRG
jgi:hypothetical protein